MYGDLTTADTQSKVRDALENCHIEQVEVLLYKKNSEYDTRDDGSLKVFIHLETPIWVFMQIAPITNERDTIVLFLCTFTDITVLKQPIETEDTKSNHGSVDVDFDRIIGF
jgi:potassium voltage-gated channel Eag-related subfamily H member 1